MFPPYRPDNVFGFVHKEALKKGDYDPGDYSYPTPRATLKELFAKPKGKVGEISIRDEKGHK